MLSVRDKKGLTALDRLIEKVPESAQVSADPFTEVKVTSSLMGRFWSSISLPNEGHSHRDLLREPMSDFRKCYGKLNPNNI